jgi:hypothetical protein
LTGARMLRETKAVYETALREPDRRGGGPPA